MKSFKALSALLSYPSRDLQEALPAIRKVLGEGLLPQAAVASLAPLLASLEADDLYDLQERYVLLFDRSRTLSLNLYAVEGYSHKEIGELLGIGESTSRSQYARAKTLLSKMITEKQKVAVTNAK